MTRDPSERFTDMLGAIAKCRRYANTLDSPDLGDMAMDAVLRNLAVIGEAARALPAAVKETMPEVRWASISGLRNIVVHEYFRIDRAVILDVIDSELTPLAEKLQTALSERDAAPPPA